MVVGHVFWKGVNTLANEGTVFPAASLSQSLHLLLLWWEWWLIPGSENHMPASKRNWPFASFVMDFNFQPTSYWLCGFTSVTTNIHINVSLIHSDWKLIWEVRQFLRGVDWLSFGDSPLSPVPPNTHTLICCFSLINVFLETNKEDWRGVGWNSFLPR